MGSLVAELAEKLSSATNNLDFDEQTLFLNTSADTVGIGTNSPGAKLDVRGSALFNEGGADADFRIEGDSQTHLFFLDASTDRIGINSATPGVQFDVVGATKITGATTQIGALTVGVDDTGHDVIFYGASASSNFHWDESADDLILNDARLLIEQDDAERAIYINQDGNSQAIYINNNGTASGIYLDNNNSGFAIEIENTGSTVSGLQIYSNQGNSQNSALSNFIADNTDFDQNVMQIQNDGTGYGLKIDQNGNNSAIYIDAENTTSSVVQIEADALTTGHILNIYSASSSNATRNLVRIWNDHASATDTTALYVLQDSTDFALHVNKSGAAGSYVAKIESTYTGDGHNVMLVKGGANESDSKVFEVQDQNGNVDLVVLGTGRVGIGTASPNSALSVSGAFGGDTNFFSIYSTGTVLYRRFYFTNSELYFWNGTNNPYLSGTGAWTDASDEKIKKNIEDIDYGLETINTLKPRKFKHKANDVEDIGFIAQEVEKVVPEIVPSVGPDESAGKGLAYGRLTSILTKAVQELSAKNDALEAKVTALENA